MLDEENYRTPLIGSSHLSHIDSIKAQSLNFKSMTHEAQLEDQKLKKSSKRLSRRRKNGKASKKHENPQTKQNGK
jgi:hypothetical protein